MQILFRPSSHFDERANGAVPSIIVIHYTETKTFQDAEDIFLGKMIIEGVGRVSAHYMIDRDGSVTQYVKDEDRAWHAGISSWNGLEDINSHSIGIELVHEGHDAEDLTYPDAQIEALILLCRDLMQRHNIQPENVVGHSDIAPDRKIDPGEFFPWDKLVSKGIALRP